MKAGAEAVVGIASEVAAEHFFLVEEVEDHQRDHTEESRERPPGAKRKVAFLVLLRKS